MRIKVFSSHIDRTNTLQHEVNDFTTNKHVLVKSIETSAINGFQSDRGIYPPRIVTVVTYVESKDEEDKPLRPRPTDEFDLDI